MNDIALNELKIEMIDALVDNGKNGYWYRSWYENRYGLKDSQGNWVVRPLYADLYKSEDMYTAIYKGKHGKKILFFDKYGKLAFNPDIEIIETRDFKNGCALVLVAGVESIDKSVPWTYVVNLCKWGLMDKNGNFIVEPKFDYENEVQITDKKMLVKLIKDNGCSILNYASPSLLLDKKDIITFKRAIKYYLLKEYAITHSKEELKQNCLNQNSTFKQIRKNKLRESLLNLKTNTQSYEREM